MNEVAQSMREQVLRLEESMRSLPQETWVTNHYFAGGMYAREMHHPAGMLVVGKIHKKESFFILTKGSVSIVLDEGVQEFSAPTVLVTKPGTKRAVLSIDGATYMTVHRTDKKNLKKIEKEVVENDSLALYDHLNQPKMKELA